MAVNLGISNRVKFIGKVTQQKLCQLYASASFVVCPSLVEAYPLVIGEARACGALVVASDIAGHREQILHNTDGVLFSSGCPKSLSAAIDSIFRGEVDTSKIAKRGYDRSISNTWEEVAARTAAFFERVVSNRGNENITPDVG